MLNNETIPEEFQVTIDDKIYDSRDPRIMKDFATGGYLHVDYSRYISLPRFKEFYFNEDNKLVDVEYNYLYTKSQKTITITLISNYKRSDRKVHLSFIDQSELNTFMAENNVFKGVNTKFYFHESCKHFDRKMPYYFNNQYRKQSVYDFLHGQVYIDDNSKITKEYKEIKELLFNREVELGMESRSFLALEGIKHTFGVELETVSGCFEDFPQVFKDINVSSVFDGSLRDVDDNGERIGEPYGAEYVTGVLKGDAGLKHVHKITNILNERCTVDKRCAFHVHIGSLKWNSEEIVYCYLLGLILESELFQMMPKSRRDNEYCKKLKPLSTNSVLLLLKSKKKENYKKAITALYNQIFKIVSSKSGISKPDNNYNKKSNHPLGRHGGYNRETDHRYSWLNFTNIIFNQRGSLDSKTIEFRNHSGTLAYSKIHNWIKICMAFVEYVHNHKKDILECINGRKTITIETIIKASYPKSGERLIKYVELRKQLFNFELNQDADYKQEVSNLKNIKEIICV